MISGGTEVDKLVKRAKIYKDPLCFLFFQVVPQSATCKKESDSGKKLFTKERTFICPLALIEVADHCFIQRLLFCNYYQFPFLSVETRITKCS